jgi:N utilization substance protein B
VSTSRGPSARSETVSSGGGGERRRSRERALQILYEAECKDIRFDEVLSDLPAPPAQYAVVLVLGVERELGRIDDLVSRHAAGWDLERMPAIDRSILRVACYELISELDVPLAVVIDEAVDLAKEYSTEESGRYVNGVLSAIGRSVRPAVARPAVARPPAVR